MYQSRLSDLSGMALHDTSTDRTGCLGLIRVNVHMQGRSISPEWINLSICALLRSKIYIMSNAL